MARLLWHIEQLRCSRVHACVLVCFVYVCVVCTPVVCVCIVCILCPLVVGMHTARMKAQLSASFPVQSSPTPVHSVEAALAECAAQGHKVKLCVFSHISSMPALVEPVAELTAVAHAHGALVLVDGAHIPGQIPVAWGTAAGGRAY